MMCNIFLFFWYLLFLMCNANVNKPINCSFVHYLHISITKQSAFQLHIFHNSTACTAARSLTDFFEFIFQALPRKRVRQLQTENTTAPRQLHALEINRTTKSLAQFHFKKLLGPGFGIFFHGISRPCGHPACTGWSCDELTDTLICHSTCSSGIKQMLTLPT